MTDEEREDVCAQSDKACTYESAESEHEKQPVTSENVRQLRDREINKNSDIIEGTVIVHAENDIEECSMRKNAHVKFTPLMSSTMDMNSCYTQQMMDATVIVEPLSPIKLNGTVVVDKNLASNIGKNNEPKFTSRSSITLQKKIQQLREVMRYKEFDELLREEGSSSDVEKSKGNIKKQEIKERQKRQNKSARLSEDAALGATTKPSSKKKDKITEYQEIKTAFK
ncbi:uncharacterized protein LOC122577516 [Bombus pyrosoma]|uniref:uncharacterized protein LOC122577516 n=1 Tax=Bombus pyrosoma TaxID=396416 RepID=UPI001CB9201E|nr:uncharacterized protein LOC122577516 [Bombus pyrosoma]